MDERPASPPKRRMSIGAWIFATTLLLILLSLAVPYFSEISDKANLMTSASHCAQITMALKVYADDDDGHYPSGSTANEAFRHLIRAYILHDEHLFGCPASPFQPDGKIRESPAYSEVIQANENHWMLVGGMDRDSSEHLALVFENCISTDWPPKWDIPSAGLPVRARPWRGSKITIGRNDCSVTVEKLDPNTGHLESQTQPDAPFPIPQGNLKLLDIEE